MTIGVAASGPNAGAAVRAAVLGAELLGRGAIGGFAVYGMLDEQRRVRHRVTQHGGITSLSLPDSWLEAQCAAAISSGPDRLEPLEQFLPGIDGVGLVTGHRLPNSPDGSGVPVNQAVLARMAAGDSPQQAVDAVLDAHPEVDAGMIALSADGRLGCGDSRRVRARADHGMCSRDNGHCRITLLHNSIYSHVPLADILIDLAWPYLTGEPAAARFLSVGEALPIRASERDRVHITAHGEITAIDSANPLLPSAHRRATAIYLGSEVWQDGRPVGEVLTELITEVSDGAVCRPSGEDATPIIMRAFEHRREPADAGSARMIRSEQS